MKNYSVAGAFLLCFLYSMVCVAQTKATHSIRIYALPVLELKFDETINKTDFYFQTLEDYDFGKVNLNATALKVKSNKNWVVNVRASAENFESTFGQDQLLKSNILSVRKKGTNNEIAINTFDQILASGPNGGFEKNHFNLDYIAKPGYISPDTYTLELVYTLTTP